MSDNLRNLPTDRPLRVGVVGLGNMGMPMALNLIGSGHYQRINVFGRTPEHLKPAVEAGAHACDTAAELAKQSDVLISMLPDLGELETLLSGDDGLLSGNDHPQLLIICSTSSPEGIRRLSQKLDQQTDGLLRMMDAPVSGGTEGANAGTLSIMVGGEASDFVFAEPVLAAMGSPVLLGPLGAGQVAKACNQVIVAATMVALSESTVIAERAGLDVELLLKTLANGYAGSRLLETKGKRLIEKDYSPAGIARYMIKDLGFARSEAGRNGIVTPQLDALTALFDDLEHQGLADQDLTVIQQYISQLQAR